ncbi:GNAT family N-acetyltransferase [Algihabitans albus]|uniref:GNAT family N-acetyltransferase n=1 Tax=Algihabitans albus TaxID=2164067 RepID=UPI000E5D53B5|nr:GNAT family N-acetyltransferase [Algihabitans albus]
MELVEGDLERADVAALLAAHLDGMAALSPPESVHALGLEELRRPEVTFWSLRDEDEVLGCGALKEIGAGHGEIKSMRTAEGHQRKGVAATLLRHMLAEAQARGYRRVSLETGSTADFAAAHALYERFGFLDCAPFGDYREDPHSRYMTLEIQKTPFPHESPAPD